MFTIIGAMAELERSVICERVLSGLEYARTHGTKSGRPVGRPIAVFNRSRVAKLRHAGRGWLQTRRAWYYCSRGAAGIQRR